MSIGRSDSFSDNDTSSGAEFMQSSVGQGSEPQVLQQRYKFTPDELRVLRECNRESFYYRCLPLGTFLGVGAYYAVRMGYLKPSARWGAGPKMFFSSVVGYFIGKFSYQGKCAEKIMQLPNSQLADMLRKQKGKLGFQETLSMEPGFVSAAPMLGGSSISSTDYGKFDPANFTDVGDTRPMTSFDTESSNFTGVDYGNENMKQMLNDDNLPQKRPQFITTYDELRKQNRDEFEHRPTLQCPSGGAGYEGSKKQYTPPRESLPKIKNAYGDVWDEKPQ